ncbi:MAG: hypothetical protein JOZ51_04570 [Chloroflexi bacterium]|nr:hypothetical protein [Chloroflexota bacterium]
MPVLSSPFVPALNPHAADVERETIVWASTFDLIRPADVRRFYKLQYGILMGRAYPEARREALQAIADWNTWLFLLDDQCDEAGIGKQPAALARLHQDFLEILHGRAPGTHALPAAQALADLRQRLVQLAHPGWFDSFISQVERYFTANIWEATNRLQRSMPTSAEYFKHRPWTGGLDMYFHFIALARRKPALYMQTYALKRLAQHANNVVCWSNDIFSLEKEARSGDVHNLVLILQHESRLSLQAAVDLVAARHNGEIRSFQALETSVPSDIDARWFVEGLRFWMRANMDWSAATLRYRPCVEQPAAAPVYHSIFGSH